MRVIVVLIGFFTSFFFTFKRPFYGVLTYIIIWYMNPGNVWWGKTLRRSFGIRTSLFISIVILISFIIHRQKLEPINKHINKVPDVFLWILLFILMFTGLNAVVSSEDGWAYAMEFLKRIVLYYLFSRILSSNKELRLFIWVNLIGCWYFGYEAIVDDYMVGGRLEGLGGPGTTDSEGLATHFSIFIPFLGIYFLSGNKWEKIAVFLITPFILNAFVLCRTRGAFLAVTFAAMYFIVMGDKKYRLKMIALMILAVIGFVSMADDAFWERMATLKNPTEEGSAASRLDLWKGAIGMVNDYPLGVGGDNYRLLMNDYVDTLERARPAHSTYFTMLAEQGYLGLIVYLFMLFYLYRTFRRLAKLETHSKEEDRWKLDMFGLECGFLTFLINQAVVNRFITEAFYWIMAFLMAGDKIYKHNMELREQAKTDPPEDQTPDSEDRKTGLKQKKKAGIKSNKRKKSQATKK